MKNNTIFASKNKRGKNGGNSTGKQRAATRLNKISGGTGRLRSLDANNGSYSDTMNP